MDGCQRKKIIQEFTEDWMEGKTIHVLEVKDGGCRRLRDSGQGCKVTVGECYLCVREWATQGRGAGGREAHSPPLLLQCPGQLFKLHLLLPDRLQQSCSALTLLHTHYTAPRGKRGALHTSIQPQTLKHYSTRRGNLTGTDTPLRNV